MKMASGECGPVQSKPRRAGFFDRGGDDFGVLPAEEVVLAGVRVEAADADARRAAEHEAHGFGAELDGADDAAAVEVAGLLERDVRGDVDGGELLAGEQHARFGGAAEFGDVFGVAGEVPAGEGDGFLVERRGDHGVGFAGEAHLGGAADVVDGGSAVFGGELGRSGWGASGSRAPGETKRMRGSRRSR